MEEGGERKREWGKRERMLSGSLPLSPLIETSVLSGKELYLLEVHLILIMFLLQRTPT